MLNVRRQHRPSVHLLLPNRSLRRREIPVVEAPYCDTKLIWTKIESPADRCAADRAEVVVQFAPIWTVSGIDSVLTFEPNLRLPEIGVAGQRHASASLTHLAVANGNSIRLALDNDTKSATLAARSPRHCKSPGVPNRPRSFDYSPLRQVQRSSCNAATLSRPCRCWVTFDRVSRFGLPVDVHFGWQATDWPVARRLAQFRRLALRSRTGKCLRSR
jgi:hypothetical protein